MNYPNYAISNLGQVKSLRYNRFLKPAPSKYGYHYVNLTHNTIVRTTSIHSMVMKYFGDEKPGENYVVDHKNKNKQDNRIENLEWVTTQINTLRGYGNQEKKRKVYELHDKGLTYPQIAKETGYSYQFVRSSILLHKDLKG